MARHARARVRRRAPAHASAPRLPLLPLTVAAALVLVAASGASILGPERQLTASRAEAPPAADPAAAPLATPSEAILSEATPPGVMPSEATPPATDPGSATPSPAVTAPATVTEAVLTVEEVPQERFRPGAATGDRPAAALTCRLRALDASLPRGTTSFLDFGAVIAVAPAVPDPSGGAVGKITVGTLAAGPHDLSCGFTGESGYAASTSPVVVLQEAAVAAEPLIEAAQQAPAAGPAPGGLSITTPFTPGSPLTLGPALFDTASSTFSAQATLGDPERGYLGVVDQREGDRGFSVSVVASPFASAEASFAGRYVGLQGLRALQVPGSALRAEDVTLTDRPPFTDGLDTVKEFLRYPPALGRGEVQVTGVLGVARVPSSAPPGRYTSVVVFTVL